jgi:prefoldin beta subunit
MSTEISKLPPHVQQRLLRLQQLQQTFQSIATQKQQVELELAELEQALTEVQKLEKAATIYKTIGSILVKKEKDKIITDLNERKELLTMRVTVLGKQDERLRSQLKDLQTKLQQDLKMVSPTG